MTLRARQPPATTQGMTSSTRCGCMKDTSPQSETTHSFSSRASGSCSTSRCQAETRVSRSALTASTRPRHEKGHVLHLQGRMELAEVRPYLRQGLYEDDRTRAQVLHQRWQHFVHVHWRQPDAVQDGDRRQPHRGIRGNGLPARRRDPSQGHHHFGHGDFPIIQLQGSSPSCIQSAHSPPCADESSRLCSKVMPFCSLRPYYTQQPSIALSVLSSGFADTSRALGPEPSRKRFYDKISSSSHFNRDGEDLVK